MADKKAINPQEKYSLQEILDNKLVRGIDTYIVLYRLVTKQVQDEESKNGKRNIPNDLTSRTTIKSAHEGKPWNKISGKIFVKGSELLKFIEINNL